MAWYTVFLFILFLASVISDQNDLRHFRHSKSDSRHETTPIAVVEDTTTNRNTEETIPLKNKVNIKVYYETLCPASVDFIVTQLKPVVERLSSYLDVQLIPYGHATTRLSLNGYIFSCQHGPAECYGNKLHACTLDKVKNSTEAVLFNACLMEYSGYRRVRHKDFSAALNWCGHKQRVLVQGIYDCVHNNHGSILLEKYGVQTHSVSPKFVPYLVLDDDITYQDQATVNLLLVVCHLLIPTPPECYYNYEYYTR